jgi:hypothetical protein
MFFLTRLVVLAATDQGLFFSYDDFDVSLHPARDCARSKCPTQWSACEAANPNYAVSASSAGALGGASSRQTP